MVAFVSSFLYHVTRPEIAEEQTASVLSHSQDIDDIQSFVYIMQEEDTLALIAKSPHLSQTNQTPSSSTLLF